MSTTTSDLVPVLSSKPFYATMYLEVLYLRTRDMYHGAHCVVTNIHTRISEVPSAGFNEKKKERMMDDQS